MAMSQRSVEEPHPFARTWKAFLDAYQAGDDASALVALKAWEVEWDKTFLAGDFSSHGAVYTPDVEILNHTRIIGFSTYRGIDVGFRRWREDTLDVASRFKIQFNEIRRVSNTCFVGIGVARARGRFSGLLMRFPLATVWTLRGSRISRVDGYSSRRKALKTAGLRE
jgi:hypothetical protein